MADDEQKYFSLTEAERLRSQLEPLLIEAMESRRDGRLLREGFQSAH
jgi:hypothetical protein